MTEHAAGGGPGESDYLHCIRCGLCLAACPTYRFSLSETASPRGRVALARKGLEGEPDLGPNLYEQMYACFACMACNDICPVGIRPAELALKMRRHQEALAPSRWKTGLFGSAFIVSTTRDPSGMPTRFTLIGAGWGHGVGLCQIGATVMAEKGYTAEEILRHYFRGTALVKRY